MNTTQHNSEHKNVILPVSGMHCASCAFNIEQSLQELPGIKSCQVNVGTEKAKIEFDPNIISVQQMNENLSDQGYQLMEESHHHAGQTPPHELHQTKKKLYFLLPTATLIFILMIWDIIAQGLGWLPMIPVPKEWMNYFAFVLATPTMFWAGKPFLKGILSFIKSGRANMDTLVGIGTLTAYLFSTAITFISPLQQLLSTDLHTYFDVTIIVIAFIVLGKYLEANSKMKTGEAIRKLIGLQAKTALVERDGQEHEIPIDQVQLNDLIIVKPGGKVPVDGIIISGQTSIDESMITGESIPSDKNPNDTVIGGTINKQGHIKFKATKIGSDTMLAQIITMVEQAQGSKAPIQKMVDRLSAIFVPSVLVLAVLTLFIWLLVAPYYMPYQQALSHGLIAFVSILVIACPCALGLATPTAIIVGTGKGAGQGILIKDAESLEKLHKIRHLVTDKTGTITIGKPVVTDMIVEKNTGIKSENEALAIISALEKKSEHPLALAILEKARQSKIEIPESHNFSITEGQGLQGTIDGVTYFAGNQKLLEKLGLSVPREQMHKLSMEGKTPVFLCTEKELLAIIGIADTLREGMAETIKEIHRLKIKITLLSGDNKNTAEYIAGQAGIDEVMAEVLPQDKAAKIKELQQNGELVAMIGDGINDAPALAQADIGIAMGTGTDVAIESAQITLLHGDFSKVLKALKLSRFTMSAIKQNLFWAFIYNIIGIPLAAGIFFPFTGWLLNPIFAGLAMAMSSVSVVTNSLRLKTKKL